MQQADGFLSYTRKDDEFFGGYITEFRKMLQNAVHVVTGETSFQVFQDIEGIVIGEKWERRLAEIIHASSFFIPVLSPLFFNSGPCRDEVTQFLKHERTLDRDDLILPLYFVDSPRIEKAEEKAKDPVAQEIASRQIFDWRQNAGLPLHDPMARRAILVLAGEVAERLQTFDAKPPDEKQRQLRQSGYEGFATDPRVAAGVTNAKREELTQRTILWVDDSPDNNIWERRALESYGVRFSLARDTDTAERLLFTGRFAAIISDMGRPGDRKAGLTLLDRVRKKDADTPFFLYTSERVARAWPLSELSGAQGITADPDALVQMVVAAIT